MHLKRIILQVEEYASPKELNPMDRQLLEQAQQSHKLAYAPYSNFKVGAAVLLEDGGIITGSNQESVAYPTGLCAERVALFYAQSTFPGKAVKALAIASESADFTLTSPVTPCGACRQMIAEYENRHRNKIRIIMGSNSGKVQIVQGVENLLPLMFFLEELKKQ